MHLFSASCTDLVKKEFGPTCLGFWWGYVYIYIYRKKREKLLTVNKCCVYTRNDSSLRFVFLYWFSLQKCVWFNKHRLSA